MFILLFGCCTLIFVCLSLFTNLLKRRSNVSDAYRNVFEVIESRGFNAESHEVETKDGYVLTLYRIVNPLVKPINRKPVLLQHGFLSNSSHWIVNSDTGYLTSGTKVGLSDDQVGNNLGFELAKRGYDVWLGNNRGNRFSRKHKTLDADIDLEYWDYSMDEFIKYDIPALIDYIIGVTRLDTLAFVGFSQGFAQMAGLLSTETKYNDIIKPFVGIAPCSCLKHSDTLIIQISRSKALRDYLSRPGPLVMPATMAKLRNLIISHILERFLVYILFLAFKVTFGLKNLDKKRSLVHLAHTFETAARKHLLHSVSRSFSKFNYSRQVNQELYGADEPPLYPLENITNKYMALIYSSADEMITPRDVLDLKCRLTAPLIADHNIVDLKMEHLDTQIGRNAGNVNMKVIQILQDVEATPLLQQ